MDTEPAYDNVIVEAHTVGQDNWTTLPEVGGATSTARPAECDDPASCSRCTRSCATTSAARAARDAGTTGTWNAITGSTGGWQQVAYDLSAFAGAAGRGVDQLRDRPGVGGVGAFVDDTQIVIDGAVTDADGFEGATSSWTPAPPPADSPQTQSNWVIGPRLENYYAATSTRDTLLLGFGFEQLESDAKRNELMSRALNALLG